MAYFAHLLINWVFIALLCLGLTLTLGRLGLFNVAHLVAAGTGAYLSAFLVSGDIAPSILGVMSAAAAGAAVLTALAGVAARCRPDAFALASLSIAAAFVGIVRNSKALTGGARGRVGVPPVSIAGVEFSGPKEFVALALIVLVACYFFTSRLVHSRYGRTLVAIRDDSVAAAVRGLQVHRFRASALAAAGAVAGVAGALSAHYLGVAQPNQYGIEPAFVLISVAVLGGVASPRGALVAAAVYVGLPELLRLLPLTSSELAAARQIIFSALLIIALMWAPKGLAGEKD